MKAAVLVLFGVNYCLIMSLPFVFFEMRDRRRAPMWWVTAAPFVMLPGFLALPEAGIMPPFVAAGSALGQALSLLALVSGALSVILVVWAVGAHLLPPPQWHQRNDLPGVLTTWGPYARVRHPFYLAYLLMFLSAAAIMPNVGTACVLVYAALVLNYTAAREERRLCRSRLGDQYRAYIDRSGRFLPVIARRRA